MTNFYHTWLVSVNGIDIFIQASFNIVCWRAGKPELPDQVHASLDLHFPDICWSFKSLPLP
jgi:hypothetical protein